MYWLQLLLLLPHVMVNTGKTQGFIRQLCLESFIVSLLKEELETWHHPSRKQREQGKTRREIKSWAGNRTSRRQTASPAANSQLSLTLQWLSACALPAQCKCPGAKYFHVHTAPLQSNLSKWSRAPSKQHIAPAWIQETRITLLVKDFCRGGVGANSICMFKRN